jgi:hypothetical protein
MATLIKPAFGKLPHDIPSRKGLVLDLPMLGVGDLYDYSLNGNNGTNNGATWLREGPALSFAVGDDVRIPYSPILDTANSDFTISILTRWDDGSLVSSRNDNTNFWDIVDSAGRIAVQIFGDNGTDINDPTLTVYNGDGVTRLITLVVKSEVSYTLYINGVLEPTASGSLVGLSNIGNGADVMLGTFRDFSPGDFEGIIYSAELYNRALSAAEIKNLHDNPYAAWEPNNIALWVAAQGGGIIPTQYYKHFLQRIA